MAEPAKTAFGSSGLAEAERNSGAELQNPEVENTLLRLELDKRRLHLERYRARLEQHRVHHDIRKPYVESGIRFADVTVRSLLILNGGAALALLAFAGNTATKTNIEYLPKLAPALQLFGWGATLSVATPALSYLAQMLLLRPSSGWKWELGVGLRIIAILSAAASLVMFFMGIQRAASGLF